MSEIFHQIPKVVSVNCCYPVHCYMGNGHIAAFLPILWNILSKLFNRFLNSAICILIKIADQMREQLCSSDQIFV